MTNRFRIGHVRFWILPAIFIVPMLSRTLSGQTTSRSAVSTMAGDSAAVAAAVNKYHAALTAGDSTGALALLAPDVMILESGGVETRSEYRSHHLAGDIAFAKGVASVRAPMTVHVAGDVAWTTATSTTQGQYNARPINSAGAESMVLSRTRDGWRIRSIHWSSRSRTPR
ncbi:MAG: nuclear transport factor 2 family protein [Gemmatimonadaceae bacterium]